MENAVRETGMKLSAWLIYVLIVFEIIFMISPAAFYYYSVYGLPLNFLVQNPYTSWLTQYILPHFTFHQSMLAGLLIAISWPLIIFGLIMFLWGFAQIYYAKFTRGGEVSTGLYRYIRHPQYTALAIVGFGTTLFWSRFLVLVVFITMMFLYVVLARVEEQRCLRQFGDSYRDYLVRTGRFLPLGLTSWLPQFSRFNGLGVAGFYLLTLALMLPAGWLFKLHVIEQMNVKVDGNITAVAVAPMDVAASQQVLAQAAPLIPQDEPTLVYIVPGSWNIPELGIQGERGYSQSPRAELAHPMMHGNLPGYEGTSFYVLVTRPVFRTLDSDGLENVVEMEPQFRIDLDTATGEMQIINDLKRGKWDGIPVPVY